MGTVIKPIVDQADMLNPHIVKCVIDSEGYALYFSRAPIPYHRDTKASGTLGFKHLGLYAYTKNFLMEFTRWRKGILESIESLEQLRALEHGIKIKTTITDTESLAVDTPQDLEKAIQWYAQSKLTTK